MNPAGADAAPADEQSDINLTPMLDVVFIMLIFFIVTAVFVREPGIDVMRPQARTATLPATVSVYVAIGSNDEIWIDGHRVDPDTLRHEIRRLHDQSPAGDIVIQADADSSSAAAMAVMDAAKAAGFPSALLATEGP